ncbi:helix-turn-helix domain-containing protein [Sphingopyxis flava]|uniref:helix-turn-helix domain-containing protein n=1 Tax=Sphingopyxis flava TaxID=1507287 RepID=UPI0009A6DA95
MERTRRGLLRSNDPEGTLAPILDAAADLSQARGHHDRSVHDVKRAAGVSCGAFHRHFESKSPGVMTMPKAEEPPEPLGATAATLRGLLRD